MWLHTMCFISTQSVSKVLGSRVGPLRMGAFLEIASINNCVIDY